MLLVVSPATTRESQFTEIQGKCRSPACGRQARRRAARDDNKWVFQQKLLEEAPRSRTLHVQKAGRAEARPYKGKCPRFGRQPSRVRFFSGQYTATVVGVTGRFNAMS